MALFRHVVVGAMIDITEAGYAFVDIDLENCDRFVRVVRKSGRIVAGKKHQRVGSHVLRVDGPSDLKGPGLWVQDKELPAVSAFDEVMNLRKKERLL